MTTLKDAVELTFEVRPSWIEGPSVGTNRTNTNHALRILGDDLDISTIRPSTFAKLGKQVVAEGREPGTANRIMAALHTCLHEVHLEGLLDAVPSYRRMKEPPARKDFYSHDELKVLLAAAPGLCAEGELLKDSLLFFYLTGCRKSELLNLMWSDVDLANQKVIFRDTKNGLNHELAIHKDLQSLLETLHEARIDDWSVFAWTTPDMLNRRMKRLCKKTGIGIREDGKASRYIHQIRHTTATHMVEAEVPIKSIQGVLNHKDINTTLKYAKDTEKSKAQAIAKIDSPLN